MSGAVFPLHKKDFESKIALSVDFEGFVQELKKVLSGKEKIAEVIVCAILSGGHVLLEDVPGVGKTTVIKALSQLLGLEMKRIQCTSDLLPSDILGVEVFNPSEQKFVFHPGPIFSPIVLADELNRASPRTQSALLEAMGEGAVSIDKKTYQLPTPFILFAAQNPSDHLGTYPLPESQLDRFAIKIRLDYPENKKELEIFTQASLNPLSNLGKSKVGKEELIELQNKIDHVHISERVAQYVKRFVDATRNHESLKRGVSTRGGISWIRLAKAHALISKRDYVIPDDLMITGSASLSHRVIPQSGNDPKEVIENLLSKVDIE